MSREHKTYKRNRTKEVMKTIEKKSERTMTLLPSKVAALAAAALGIAALALIVGGSTGRVAASSGGSSAVGGFTAGDLSHVAFAAQMNAQNTSVTGNVVQDLSTGSRSGPVICLNVNGNRARVLWTVKQSDFPGEVGQTRQFDVMDNGDPTGGVPKDFYTDLQQCDPNGTCSTSGGCCCVAGTASGVLFHGNIIVSP
jgi:hypothetical protein